MDRLDVDEPMQSTTALRLCGGVILAIIVLMILLHLLSQKGAHPFAFIIPSLSCGWCFGLAAGRHVEGAR